MDTNPITLPARARIRLGGMFANAFFRGFSRLGRTLPLSNPERYGVVRTSNLQYWDTGLASHQLDVYRAKGDNGLKPIVIYIHGGGFKLCSKDTHWLPGVLLAKAGYTVFNINYRLGPEYRFPDPLIDCTKALQWVVKNASSFGGDPNRMAFAGESAGGNLATSLAICTLYERPEPYAKEVWDLGLTPQALLPAAGILQVSDPERFQREYGTHWFYSDRVSSICRAYYPRAEHSPSSLADPLLILEGDEAPARKMPPFFALTSTGDPIMSDTLRLKRAVERHSSSCELINYDNEMHAFHMFYFKPNAKDSWKQMLAFLTAQLPPTTVAS